MLILPTLLLILLPLQIDRSDKRCIVTKVVTEGVYSDCGGWQPAKGEKFHMPAEVSRKLRVGDVYYFVWKETYWLAVIRNGTP